MVSAISSSSAHTTPVNYLRSQSKSQEEKGEINPGADEAVEKAAATAKADSTAQAGRVNIVA